MQRGGVSIYDGGSADLTGCRIFENEAVLEGGGLNVGKGYMTLTNSKVFSNVASNVFQGLSAGLDGRILLWDLDDATILRAFCVGRPILAMSLHATMPSTAFVLTSPEGKAAPAGTPRYAEGLAHGGRTYAASIRETPHKLLPPPQLL